MLSAEVRSSHVWGGSRCCRGPVLRCGHAFVCCFPALLAIVECLCALLPESWLHAKQILVKNRLCFELPCPWLLPTPLQQAICPLLWATHQCWAWPLRGPLLGFSPESEDQTSRIFTRIGSLPVPTSSGRGPVSFCCFTGTTGAT